MCAWEVSDAVVEGPVENVAKEVTEGCVGWREGIWLRQREVGDGGLHYFSTEFTKVFIFYVLIAEDEVMGAMYGGADAGWTGDKCGEFGRNELFHESWGG